MKKRGPVKVEEINGLEISIGLCKVVGGSKNGYWLVCGSGKNKVDDRLKCL